MAFQNMAYPTVITVKGMLMYTCYGRFEGNILGKKMDERFAKSCLSCILQNTHFYVSVTFIILNCTHMK
jgi:hypothetical protein